MKSKEPPSKEQIADTRRKIAIMQAFCDGEAVSHTPAGWGEKNWSLVRPWEEWDWHTNNYRVATSRDFKAHEREEDETMRQCLDPDEYAKWKAQRAAQ